MPPALRAPSKCRLDKLQAVPATIRAALLPLHTPAQRAAGICCHVTFLGGADAPGRASFEFSHAQTCPRVRSTARCHDTARVNHERDAAFARSSAKNQPQQMLCVLAGNALNSARTKRSQVG